MPVYPGPIDVQFAELSGRNVLMNGAFLVNQREFTSTTTNGYGFDRWIQYKNSGTVTMSAQAVTLGSPPAAGYEVPFSLRQASSGQSGADAYSFIRQHIEDVRTLAGATVTVSFWAKAASGTPSVAIEAIQDFGSGGSPSALVTGICGQKVAITTSWARYSMTFAVPSIAGKTIGTTANTSNVYLVLWTSAGTDFNARTDTLGIQSATIDFWGIQLERGSVATPFELLSYERELEQCQRYFVAYGGNGVYESIPGSGMFASTTVFNVMCPTKVMRVVPTLTSSGNWQASDGTAAFAASAMSVNSTQSGVGLASITGTVAGATQHRVARLETANSTASRLYLSAEF